MRSEDAHMHCNTAPLSVLLLSQCRLNLPYPPELFCPCAKSTYHVFQSPRPVTSHYVADPLEILASTTLHSCAAITLQVCNHPALSYPPDWGADQAELLRQCGKLCVLDRLLIKLHRTGHRVLLFSTMTRLLDLLEAYLRWRRFGPQGTQHMAYARIDGGTALEDRYTLCSHPAPPIWYAATRKSCIK